MIESLPQFVPQQTCLSCDGCCRFKEADSCWRPYVAPEEARSKGRLAEALAKKIDENNHIKTAEEKGCFHCAFFHPADHVCHVYAIRPFECRLYPFLLTKEKNLPAVSVHLSCPYVQEHEHDGSFKRYVRALKEYFRQGNVLKFVLRNPSLAKRYPQHENEIKHLFTLVQ
mgnify:CR=1 FL=1